MRSRVIACLLAALCASGARAGTLRPVQPGVSAGPLVLTPWIETSAGYDTNLFRAPECLTASPSCVGPQAEYFSRTSLGISSYLPIRNSVLELRYGLDKRDYQGYQPQRPREQTYAGRLRLNFGTGDTLFVGDTYTLGSYDVRNIDEGGELVFRDAPYDYNRAEIMWQRLRPGNAGFIIRSARVTLHFVEGGARAVPFFDYDGVESSLEYRHPIPGRRWLRGYFDTRRFDHFEPGQDVAFRKEDADTLQVGMGGLMGRRGNSFEARAGYGHYTMTLQNAEFNGLVGQAQMSLAVGARTRLTAFLWRRPLPSNFPTYYIVNSLRVSAERNVARNITGGVGFEHYRNQYLDPLPTDEGQEIRKDQRYIVEGYLDWALHPRLSLRFSAGHEERVSNFPDNEYATSGVSFGLRMGWF